MEISEAHAERRHDLAKYSDGGLLTLKLVAREHPSCDAGCLGNLGERPVLTHANETKRLAESSKCRLSVMAYLRALLEAMPGQAQALG